MTDLTSGDTSSKSARPAKDFESCETVSIAESAQSSLVRCRSQLSVAPEVKRRLSQDFADVAFDLSSVTHGNLSPGQIVFCGTNGAGSSTDAIVTSIHCSRERFQIPMFPPTQPR